MTAGVLRLEIYIDDSRGVAQYTGTWDPTTSTVAATATTTLSAETLTVGLTRQ